IQPYPHGDLAHRRRLRAGVRPLDGDRELDRLHPRTDQGASCRRHSREHRRPFSRPYRRVPRGRVARRDLSRRLDRCFGKIRAIQDRRSVLPQLDRARLRPPEPADLRFPAVQQEFQPLLLWARPLMLKALLARLHQGHRTVPFPGAEVNVPDRLRGMPVLDPTKCPDGCRECVDACPTGAISGGTNPFRLDLGRCLFCTDCTQACPQGAIAYTPEYRLATRRREDLIVESGKTLELAKALEGKALKLFGRSLKLRQVSAGGCNACEADV